MKDQVTHPYKTTVKIMALFVLIFRLLEGKLEDKTFFTECQQAIAEFNLLLLFFP
jgi:hypothetical protein